MKRSWFRALLLRRVQVLRSVVHIISGFLVLYIISKKDKGANKGISGNLENICPANVKSTAKLKRCSIYSGIIYLKIRTIQEMPASKNLQSNQ